MASARRSSSTDKSKRLHDSLGSAADRLLADTCAKIRGGMTLGKLHYASKSNYASEEATHVMDELRDRMNQLHVLEESVITEKKDMFRGLVVLEDEYLLSDAAVHIITHVADSLDPPVDASGIITRLEELSDEYYNALTEFRGIHGIDSDDKYIHDRSRTRERRERYARSRAPTSVAGSGHSGRGGSSRGTSPDGGEEREGSGGDESAGPPGVGGIPGGHTGGTSGTAVAHALRASSRSPRSRSTPPRREGA